jgi:HEAT repeat protein
MRIRGALAARGDVEAAAQLEREAAQGGSSCDEEEMAVRVEALNALASMDPTASRELFSRVLARRDECSAALRRRAVFLLARSADSAAARLLIDAAQSDPDSDVRSYATRWLARVPGEEALATLENLARASDDQSVQRAAVRALATHPNPRARGTLRGVIENPDAPERVRADAIAAFAREGTSAQDAAWLRAAYARLDSPRLKGRIIVTVRRLEGAENGQWLLEVSQRTAEAVDLRAAAISAAGRRESVAIDELVRLYDVMTELRLREQLISTYGRREEPQATDKLFEIVRGGTDPRLRRNAISALTRKKDPRTTRLLMELIDQ